MVTSQRKKGHEGGHFKEFSKQAKARGFKGVFYDASSPSLTDVFLLIIVFPLKSSLGFLWLSLASKVTELL